MFEVDVLSGRGAVSSGVGVTRRLVRALLAVVMVPVVVLAVPPSPAGAMDTFVVTTTGDGADTDVGDGDCIATSGGCTLRAAIQEANDDGDHDIIEFALGGPGEIVAASSLPTITEPLTIDGSTNPGANCDYLGQPATPAVPTVAISGSGIFTGNGGDDVTIRNLSIHSAPTAVHFGRNVQESSENFVLECSWLGLKLDGSVGSGQTGDGVKLGNFNFQERAESARIGGTVGQPGNVIVGFDGAAINGSNGRDDSALNNRIGVLNDGSPAGNGEGVLDVSDVRFNLIANSVGNGVSTVFGDVSFNTIRDNGGDGVRVDYANFLPPPNGPLTFDQAVRGNTISDNGGIGIDRVFFDDFKPEGDPIASSIGPDNDTVTVTAVDGNSLTFRLRGSVSVNYEIDVFSNTECDATGFGEGETFRETFAVVPNAAETFHTVTMANALSPGQSISVTATSITANIVVTSEFSNCKDESSRFVVDIPTNDGDTLPGDGVCLGPFGGCSLRAAIEEANALGAGAPDEIVFDLPAGSSIAVSGSPLPSVTVPITIDASFNPGATCGSSGSAPSGLVRLNAAPGIDVGLELAASASGTTVRGLAFSSFGADGVLVLGDDNVFECNAFGGTAGGNLGDGIDVRGNDNVVGGSFAAAGNLIASNVDAGVRLSSASFNQVSSNWIGNDGVSAIGNDVGVQIEGSATNNTVGSFRQPDGSTQGGNLIGGNTDHGVNVLGTGFINFVTGNMVGVLENGSAMANGRHGIRTDAPNVLIGRGQGAFTQLFDDPNIVGFNGESGMALFGDDVFVSGNFIGVDADGNDIGNDDYGIFLGGDDGLVRGNTIGFNGRDGVWLDGLSSEVEGNLIGLQPDGTSPAGNDESGVDVRGNANIVGGDDAVDGNVIAFNGASGVSISGGATDNAVRSNTIRDNAAAGIEALDSATRNRFVENSISDNEGLGIDLGGDNLVNPNDKEDPDTGANDFVNRPEILEVDVAATEILFRYEGTPNLAHEIEFSANLECDNSEAGEGLRPIDGLFSFTTNGDGEFEGVFDAQGGFSAGEILTALVSSTSFGGVVTTTSEYSNCFFAPGTNTTDSDGDGLYDIFELNTDTDGDGLLNRLDADDDGDGRPTAVENLDPFNSGSGNAVNALNSDGEGPVDYLDPAELFRLLDPACQVLQSGEVTGGDSIDFDVSGGVPLAATSDPNACDIPATATAVMANVIIVDPVAEGNLRLTAAGTTPSGGIVNFSANELNNTNAASFPVSASGELNVSVNLGAGSTAVAAGGIEIEILGYYEAAETPSLVFSSLVPCTVFDTRTNQGGSGPISSGGVIGIDVIGSFPASQGGGNTNCQVPSGAEGVLVNVVALNTSGIVDVVGAGSGATVVSNQTHVPSMNNSSALVLPVVGGDIALDVDVSVGTSTNLRVVVLGFYFPTMVGDVASAGLEFNSVVPCAAFDTRSNQGAAGAFAGQRTNGQATDYDVVGSFDADQGGGASSCGIPESAVAIELNLVAINATLEGNLRVAATGTTPSGGVLNFANLTPKMNNSNALVVPLGPGGQITVTTNGGGAAAGLPVTDIRGIVSGYYTYQEDFS